MIPLLKPSVSDKEIEYLTETLKGGWWGLGPKTEEFEQRFATHVGVQYAVGVNSATAALDLALRAHDVKDGEIIVPALTFVSTGLVGLYNNCKVIFADIKEDTLCIDWEDVRKKVTPNTKAIIPVHYAGRYTKAPIWVNDALHQLPMPLIIEDAAHAAGNPHVGKFNTACWSFHAVKNLATGDGGMVTTNDRQIYEKLLKLRWVGIDRTTWERAQKKYGWDYSIESIGFKSHMNDLTASLGLAQLERLEDMNNKRKVLVFRYMHELQDVKWLKLPKYDPYSSWHLFVVQVDGDRDKFIDHMLAKGVSAGVHYKPLTEYKIFDKIPLPVTDRVWKKIVTLPLFADMTDAEFIQIINAIKSYKND